MAKLFLPFRKRLLELGTKAVTLPEWAIDYLKTDPKGANSAYFMKSSWAYRCVMIRANALAAVEWEIQQPDGTAILKHDLVTLLREISPVANWSDTIRAIEADLNIYAHAYLLKVGEGKTPQALKRLNPYTMKRIYDAKKGITSFEQWIKGKKFGEFARDEIIYFHFYHPTEDFGGLSPTHMAMGAIDAESNAEKYVGAFFGNYALPAAILETDEYIDQGEAEGIVAKFRRKFMGADKQHKIALLDRGTKVKELGWPLSELALSEVRNEARRTICAAYGVPPILVGAWEAANYATADAAKKSLYTETMIPQGDYISGVLNAELVPHYGAPIKHVFCYDRLPAMQEDETKRAQRYALLVEKRVITAAAAAQRLGFTAEETGTGPVEFMPNAFVQQNDEKKTKQQVALDKWQRKALKRLKEGKSPSVGFESEYISQVFGEAIIEALKTATTKEEVKEIFQGTFDTPAIKIRPSKPPDVHVNITEGNVEIKNLVSPTPVEPTPIEVNVESPTVNIENKIEPTPVEIINKMPKTKEVAPVVTVNVEPTPIEVTNEIDLPNRIIGKKKIIRNKRTKLIDSVEEETRLE